MKKEYKFIRYICLFIVRYFGKFLCFGVFTASLLVIYIILELSGVKFISTSENLIQKEYFANFNQKFDYYKFDIEKNGFLFEKELQIRVSHLKY